MVFTKSESGKLTLEKIPGKETTEKIASATKEVVPFIRRHLALSITLLVAGLVLIGMGIYFLLKLLHHKE